MKNVQSAHAMGEKCGRLSPVASVVFVIKLTQLTKFDDVSNKEKGG